MRLFCIISSHNVARHLLVDCKPDWKWSQADLRRCVLMHGPSCEPRHHNDKFPSHRLKCRPTAYLTAKGLVVAISRPESSAGGAIMTRKSRTEYQYLRRRENHACNEEYADEQHQAGEESPLVGLFLAQKLVHAHSHGPFDEKRPQERTPNISAQCSLSKASVVTGGKWQNTKVAAKSFAPCYAHHQSGHPELP